MLEHSNRKTTMFVSISAVLWGLIPAIAAFVPQAEAKPLRPDRMVGWEAVDTSQSHYVNWLYQPDATEISHRTGCQQTGSAPGYVFLGLGRQRPGGSTAFGWDRRTKTYAELHAALMDVAAGLEECADDGKWTLVAMTSNYHLDDPALASSQGAEWGSLIEGLRAADDFSHVDFLGGSDIEPSWGSPSAARAWVEGFSSASSAPLVNGPSADGCPQDFSRATCNNGWTAEDMAYVAWGAQKGSTVLPQIYTPSGSMARQWAHLAEVAIRSGYAPTFAGTLTQRRACAGRPCNNTDIEPLRAYRQLATALADVGLGALLPGSFTSDIGWG